MFGFDKFFRSATGLDRQFGPVSVLGHELRCQICRHGEFWEHQVQLHTPAATLFNVEFANRIANCAVCANCGYVHFFLPTGAAPVPADSGDTSSHA